jgi:hypothetical protein
MENAAEVELVQSCCIVGLNFGLEEEMEEEYQKTYCKEA